jgi:hypothetical protein
VDTGSTAGVPSYLAGSATLDPSFRSGFYAEYADAIEAAAKATGVSANLLGAMVATESRGVKGNVDPLQMGGGGTMPENMLAGAKHLIASANESAAKFGTGSLGIALRDYNSGLLGTDPNNLSALPAGTGQPYYIDEVTQNYNALKNGNAAGLLQ